MKAYLVICLCSIVGRRRGTQCSEQQHVGETEPHVEYSCNNSYTFQNWSTTLRQQLVEAGREKGNHCPSKDGS